MGKWVVQCFGRLGELVSFVPGEDENPTFEFDTEYDGYISIGDVTEKFKGKSITPDLRRLEDGEYTPYLILPEVTVTLPGLKKKHGIIAPIDPSIEQIREISLRERKLCLEVEDLKSRLNEISKKVYGSNLFEILP